MFISQLCHDGETEKITDSRLSSPKNHDVTAPIRRQIGCFRKDCAYRFTRLEHILRACGRLIGVKSVCESHAYRDEGGDYLLFLTILSPSPFSIPEELDFLTEYGSIENAAILRLYIKEHATLIASPDAIAILGRLE